MSTIRLISTETSFATTKWLFPFLLAVATALLGCDAPSNGPSKAAGEAISIVPSTMYIKTVHAVANILPGGRNTPFTGIPVATMLGADSADVMLEEIKIPKLNQPVTGDIELILLNERNIDPFRYKGELYDYYYTLNPKKRSLGKMTVVQTAPDDHGSGYEGVYMRHLMIELIATLVPRKSGPNIVTEASIIVASPVPIPFSFDPDSNDIQKTGLVGDATASWHTDKADHQKNIFGLGILQIPHGGRAQFDADGIYAMAGNAENTLKVANKDGDFCPDDPNKRDPGITGCGNSDVDTNNNKLPDYYESSLVPGGTERARKTAVSYNSVTGEMGVAAPAGVELTAINISSASGIFTADAARNLDGAIDEDTDVKIFKAMFGKNFGNVNFGGVAKKGLSKEFVLGDVTARVLFADYVSAGGLDLNYFQH